MESNVNIPWDGWKCVKAIGRGGFGTVYEIERTQHGIAEKAALKVISIPQDPNEVDILKIEGYTDDGITQRFSGFADEIIREYGMMVQMKGNANIVYCDDYKIIQQDNGFGWDIYIKMELLTPLMKSLELVSSEEQIIRFGMDMCRALEVCQKRNVIHRDIKPQNIFVSDDGVFKLGDFGIARTAEKTTRATVGIGTYGFMAPEVKNGKSYGPSVDIYSLGLVMYWLLNARRMPFLPLPPAAPKHGEEERARERRFSGEKIPVPKNGSEALKAIVLKACAFDPKNRYQSAREMREDLQRLSSGMDGIEQKVSRRDDIPNDEGEEKTASALRKKSAGLAEVEDKPAEQIKPVNGERKPKKKKKAWPFAVIAACLAAVIALVLFAKPKGSETAFETESKPQYTLMEDNGDDKKVLGSEYWRGRITSVTFVDTTKNASKDAWDVSQNQDGTVLAWVKPNGILYDLFIGAKGGVLAPENCCGLFADYRYLQSINFNGAFDTSNVTDMSCMFYGCKKLSKLDVSGFDTSNVTNMAEIFRGCKMLSKLDVSGFDTSKVTNMAKMFYDCKKLLKLDVSGFDTTYVTDMGWMFYYCSNLTELDVSGFDTSNVTDMTKMFCGCKKLSKLDVSGFDTSNVTNMTHMFRGCSNLKEQDVSNFDISDVEIYDYFADIGRTINGRPWEEFFQ